MNARVAHIDGLRAVAVLAVVAYHSAIVGPHLDRSGTANFFAGQGSHGVELFFVLSGFCLSYPALARMAQGGAAMFDVGRYAAHRIVRILPPYYIALLLFAAAFAILHVHLERLAPGNLARQIAFMDRGTDFVNPSFWTLPVELRWYALMPLALWTWVRAPKLFAAALVVLVILGQQTRAQSLDLVSLPGFLFGIVAAHLCVRRSSLVRFSVPLCLLAFAVTMVVSPTRELYGTIQILWEISAALLVVAAGANGFLQRVLSLPLLAFIGAASYSIYLVHEPLMELAEARGASPGVAAVLGVLAGVGFWALAERPFVRSRIRDALLKKIEPVTYGVLHALGARASLDLSSRPPALRLERTVLAEAEKSVPA